MNGWVYYSIVGVVIVFMLCLLRQIKITEKDERRHQRRLARRRFYIG